MITRVIASIVGAALMTVSLSACSSDEKTEGGTPPAVEPAVCKDMTAQKISKRSVRLQATAKRRKKGSMRGFEFQLVDRKRDREPYHFFVPTKKLKSQHTFTGVKPGKYSARIILHTAAGAQVDSKNCRIRITVR